MTDLTSRPFARPLAENAEDSAYPEPHVELAPLAERLKVWAALLLFCAVFWGALIRAVLL